MTTRMSEAEFLRSLDTFGADLCRWPANRVAAAEALCAVSSIARAAREHAARLDALFAEDRTAETVPAAQIHAITNLALARIAGQAHEANLNAVSLWRWLFTRPVGAMMATAMLAGIVVGLLVPSGPPQDAIVTSALFGADAPPLVGIL